MKNLFLGFLLCTSTVFAQTKDELMIRQIFDKSLKDGRSYSMLEELCKQVGPRLSGSPGAAAAVEWSRNVMQEFGFDTVWLQPVMVPHWVRGPKEKARIVNSKKLGSQEVNICALGGSIGTGAGGVTGEVVEVKDFDQLKALGARAIQGKIVFFNRAMDPTKINTFEAYGGAVNQRGQGAVEAARYGAMAVVVRSMGSNLEDYPHTGGMRYSSDVPKIPAVAISTKHAELLSDLLKDDKELKLYIESHCETLPDAPSFNVIGELRGKEFPNEVIVVGGHLDSWDLAEGAHDDGAGCVQSIEALRILKAIGYQPKRTLRAVMFMNEENGLRGGLKYAEQAELKKEEHIAAIESDRGGFTPRGFTITASDEARRVIQGWRELFEPYGIADFDQRGGGADIGPLESQGTALIGFLPDSQRYFNFHHTPEDTFDKVDKRELEMGAAAMTAMVFLLDQYGLK